MAKGLRTMNLRFPDPIFAKLEAKKKESGATSWEDWVVKVSGIEEDQVQ
jgi:hypothetical protein